MNGPVEPPVRREMQRAFDEMNRRAGPSGADRERITGALRARLGASVVPEGFVPQGAVPDAGAMGRGGAGGSASGPGTSGPATGGPPATGGGVHAGGALRSGLGRGGWLGVVAGTGVVAGAFGFMLGYGMAQREGMAQHEPGAATAGAVLVDSVGLSAPDRSQEAANAAKVSSAAEPSNAAPDPNPASSAPDPNPASSAPQPLAASAPRDASGAREGDGQGAPTDRPGRAAAHGAALAVQRPSRAEGPVASDVASHQLSFAEVLERLQRANVALRRGQAPLALIRLAEIDRSGGDILREERDVTRVLALCAIGDEAGARRVAGPLLAGAASSIYAPRLAASCARDREP